MITLLNLSLIRIPVQTQIEFNVNIGFEIHHDRILTSFFVHFMCAAIFASLSSYFGFLTSLHLELGVLNGMDWQLCGNFRVLVFAMAGLFVFFKCIHFSYNSHTS